MIRLSFDRGTVLVDVGDTECSGLPGCVEDSRVGQLRAPGKSYRDIVVALEDQGLEEPEYHALVEIPVEGEEPDEEDWGLPRSRPLERLP